MPFGDSDFEKNTDFLHFLAWQTSLPAEAFERR
jgi:hypothetical protein